MAVPTPTRSATVERPTHELEIVAELTDAWRSRALAILRIAAGVAFTLHGTQKLFGFPQMDQPSPELFSLLGLAGVLEAFGGPLVALGFFTRPVAAVLCVEMAIAYAMVHLPQGIYPMLNGGEPALLFGIIFLYLSVAGGGAWSLDRRDSPA